MEQRYQFILILATMFFGTALAISFSWMWLRRPRNVGTKQLDEIAERLANLERAVDTIAVETERISEGQRFTTKLLGERVPARGIEQ
jgi:hypothetical protein